MTAADFSKGVFYNMYTFFPHILVVLIRAFCALCCFICTCWFCLIKINYFIYIADHIATTRASEVIVDYGGGTDTGVRGGGTDTS